MTEHLTDEQIELELSRLCGAPERLARFLLARARKAEAERDRLRDELAASQEETERLRGLAGEREAQLRFALEGHDNDACCACCYDVNSLAARLANYEKAISWDTTCTNCAQVLAKSYEDYVRADKAEAEIQQWRDTVMDCVDGVREQRERADAAEAKLAAVEKLCNYADRAQQPRSGVLGFVAPSTVSVADLRTALAADATLPTDDRDRSPASEPTEATWLTTDCWHCDDIRAAKLSFPESLTRRMIVCPQCGNKRCPKATHHDNPCTGSNEAGQPGSRYHRRSGSATLEQEAGSDE